VLTYLNSDWRQIKHFGQVLENQNFGFGIFLRLRVTVVYNVANVATEALPI
jgi:hypothetical protein